MKTYMVIPNGERCRENDEVTFSCKIWVDENLELDQSYTINMWDIPWKIYPVVHKLLWNGKTGEESESIVKREFLEQSRELHKGILDKLQGDTIKVYLKISETKTSIDDVFEDGTTYRTIISEGVASGRPFKESTVCIDLKIFEGES